MKTIQEMLQELSQCIVTVSGEFRFRTNWNGGKVPQPEPEKPDLDVFNPNVPFCIENVGDVKASVQYNTKNTNIRISKDYKTWNDYASGTEIELNPKDRVYIKSDYVLDESATPKFNFTNANGTRLRARGNIASLLYGSNDAYVNKYTSTEEYCYYYMFNGCKSLVQAPELPATILTASCYVGMLSGCTSLTQAPDLPATTLADYCYAQMFKGCTSLTQAPELPATTLTQGCYGSMFYNCTSLTQAPELPAATLVKSCYNQMFQGCISLMQAPELPATILARGCYDSMFDGCTSLTQAPELPATNLVEWCYNGMFRYCASLIQAPELLTATLTDSCYQNMFSGCNKLNYVKCLATNTSANNCTKDWLSGVASTGTFECDNKKYFTIDSPNGIPTGWSITEINPAQPEPEKPDLDVFDPNVPFCIENVGDAPVEIGLYNTGENAVRSNCKISTDLKTWSDYNLVLTNDDTSNDIGRILLQNKGDRVYIKADGAPIGAYPPYPYPHTQFKVFNQSESKKIRARGNIASLNKGVDDTYKTNYLILGSGDNYRYFELFKNCTSLVQAPDLPATTLASYCYGSMFYNCTSLTQAPELPATTLAQNCYSSMFYNCTSLTQAPDLPATTLANYCYQYMFARCTALINAPKLPATEMRYSCYESMFSACRSLTHAPDLPAIIVEGHSYASMFQYCTSLTQAPELPATTLANSCYVNMFWGCTSLTQAPELPATKFADYCYRWMFQDCTKLNYVKCLATDTSATDCTYRWLSNVSSTGTFECDNKKHFTLDSPNGIPTGWTITEINPDVEKPDLDVFDPNVPFCIENVGETPVEIGMYDVTSNIRNSCEISYNNKDWITYNLAVDPSPSDIKKITLSNKGDRVYIKSNHSGTTMSPTPYTRIKVLNESDTTKIQARGNIASLNYALYDEYKTKYNSTEESCYLGLFMSCKSLIKAPDLVATSLSKSCYMTMFYGCINLKYIKCGATDISATNCTSDWVRSVASKGNFYTPTSTTWPSGISGIPQGWTRHDIT